MWREWRANYPVKRKKKYGTQRVCCAMVVWYGHKRCTKSISTECEIDTKAFPKQIHSGPGTYKVYIYFPSRD